jgi:hypothetical protein
MQDLGFKVYLDYETPAGAIVKSSLVIKATDFRVTYSGALIFEDAGRVVAAFADGEWNRVEKEPASGK